MMVKRIKSRLRDTRNETNGPIHDEQIINIIQEEIQHYYNLILLD